MRRTLLATAIAATALATTPAGAVMYDQDVTPAVIFGDGNANGAFTVDRGSGGGTTAADYASLIAGNAARENQGVGFTSAGRA